MLTITNNKGRNFNVRIIHIGERYGRGDCLTHGSQKWDTPNSPPLVCFYDATYIQPENNWEYGQPIGNYYTITLLDGQESISESGLDLHGGVDAWKIDGKAMSLVIDYIKKETLDD